MQLHTDETTPQFPACNQLHGALLFARATPTFSPKVSLKSLWLQTEPSGALTRTHCQTLETCARQLGAAYCIGAMFLHISLYAGDV